MRDNVLAGKFMENIELFPVVKISSSGKKFRLDWDNQSIEADKAANNYYHK